MALVKQPTVFDEDLPHYLGRGLASAGVAAGGPLMCGNRKCTCYDMEFHDGGRRCAYGVCANDMVCTCKRRDDRYG